MIIADELYGDERIDPGIFEEIIADPAMQRLKGIAQAGASRYAVPGRDVTRFEHSVGVMLLLRRLGASTEEQLAGLLHDVCHTAFSHVVDFVYPNTENAYHERFKRAIIASSGIPGILACHGMDADKIMEEANFPLLERKIPELCADRVDYCLRDSRRYFGPSADITSAIAQLRAEGGRIIFTQEKPAVWFAKHFLLMNRKIYADPRESAYYLVLADAIRIAIREGIISEADLFMEDDDVMGMLKGSGNKEITAKLALLRPDLRIALQPHDYDYRISPKLRYVDPLFMAGGVLRRVSEVSPEFSSLLEAHRAELADGFFIKILD